MESTHRIVDFPTTHFVGVRTQTSLMANGVPALWRSFRPLAKEIVGKAEGFYNFTRYPEDLEMTDFTPATRYEAWAVARLEDPEAPTPGGMERLVVAAGPYAVFDYRGLAADFGPVAAKMFGEWLPAANLPVNKTRLHFEYLPPGYRPDAPDAHEEVWIPVVIAT